MVAAKGAALPKPKKEDLVPVLQFFQVLYEVRTDILTLRPEQISYFVDIFLNVFPCMEILCYFIEI